MKNLLMMLLIAFSSIASQGQTIQSTFTSSGNIVLDSTQLANALSQSPQVVDGIYGDIVISNGATTYSLAMNVVDGVNIFDEAISSSKLAPNGVAVGTFTNANVTTNSKGQVTHIEDGSASINTTVISGYKGAYTTLAEANLNSVDSTEGNYVFIATSGDFDFTEGVVMTVYDNPLIYGAQSNGAFNNRPMYSTKAIGLANTGAFEFFIEYLEAGDQFNAWQNDGANGLFHFHGQVGTAFDDTLSDELAVPQSGVGSESFNTAYWYNGLYRFNSN